jgi:hypothetical protein
MTLGRKVSKQEALLLIEAGGIQTRRSWRDARLCPLPFRFEVGSSDNSFCTPERNRSTQLMIPPAAKSSCFSKSVTRGFDADNHGIVVASRCVIHATSSFRDCVKRDGNRTNAGLGLAHRLSPYFFNSIPPSSKERPPDQAVPRSSSRLFDSPFVFLRL